jgi:hypothetical protein
MYPWSDQAIAGGPGPLWRPPHVYDNTAVLDDPAWRLNCRAQINHDCMFFRADEASPFRIIESFNARESRNKLSVGPMRISAGRIKPSSAL